MASSGKKGKKKGVTLAWNEFVADAEKHSSNTTTRVVTRKVGSWADEVEDDDVVHKEKVVLPSGPRATWGPDIDDNKIPKYPPFLAYISNLPYEVEEEEIEDFFKDMKVMSVRLPRDEREERGKLRGFGYVEFETRQDLIDALSLPDTNIKGRRIRIEVAAESDRRRNRDSMRSDRPNYDSERSDGDWRAGPREGPLGDMERGGGRSSGFMTRDRDAGSGFITRERDGPILDRSAPRREFGSGGFSRDGFDRDRGFRDGGREGFGDRERGGERGGWFSDRDGDRDRGRFGDREGGGFDRDRGRFGDRDRDFGRDREGGFGGPRRDYGRDELPPVDRGEPRTRPKLNLQPRTKPVEEVAAAPAAAPAASAPAASAPAASAPAPPPSGGAGASIFGGAKPVDTAARERQIEERLARERGDINRDERPRDRDGSRGPQRQTEGRDGGKENFWSSRARQNGPSDNGRASPQSDYSDPERRERDSSQRRYRSRPETPEGRDGSRDSNYGARSVSRGSQNRDYEQGDSGPRDERGRSERGRTGAPEVRASSSSSSGVERERPASRDEREEPQESGKEEKDDEVRMPKYVEQETPNFAGSNKFAYLHSDEEPDE